MNTPASPVVLEFYRTLPFNLRSSPDEHAAAVRKTNGVAVHAPLVPLLGHATTVLDVGCGPGWFANSVAHHYRCMSVLGVDFNPVAIDCAREAARRLKVNTRFEVADLFLYQPETPVDVAVSLGVLHHTNDCLAGVRRVFGFVRPGGHVLIGLYHRYGRRPFLDHFAAMQAAGADEDTMFARYRQLHTGFQDDVHARSWFRDQALHPLETQHTLAELVPVMAAEGMTLTATSLNRYQPITSVDAVVAEEAGQEQIGVQRLRDNVYFPGFFTILARKTG